MQVGVVFPQTEIGSDPRVIREYAEAVEAMGYQHLLVYDHVLGADTSSRPGWRGTYTAETMFHEPFVLFGYLAAVTRRLELVSGVIILPQRQTALVAKQAAEVDVLSGGRLRLGVGIGWNEVEYQALGEAFGNRGRRIEEQIEVLRLLFAEPVVSFDGQWHHVPAAGINPLPPRRSIPIWIGGTADAVLQRVARLGDGWFPQMPPEPAGRLALEKLRGYAEAAGRDPATIGIEARVSLSGANLDKLARDAAAWQALGATHLGINTMGVGLANVDAHLAALREVKGTLDS